MTHVDETSPKFNNTGVYFPSKFKSIRAGSFSANRRERFSKKISNFPGPADYKVDLKASGKLQLSKFKSTVAQSFPHSPRRTAISQRSSLSNNYFDLGPGPGYYETTSQFGYCRTDGEKFNK
jgi:hypothetical protein